jgi:hypothetical protein
MLATVWSVFEGDRRHHVPDLEALARGIIAELTFKSGVRIEQSEFDDWVAWALGEVHVVLAGDPYWRCRCGWQSLSAATVCADCGCQVLRKALPPFDPSRNVPCRIYVFGRVRQRTIDEMRRVWGRNGQRRLLSLAAAEQAARDSGFDSDGGWAPVGEPVVEGAGDRDDDRLADLRRLLTRRSRDVAREVRLLDRRADGRAPRRDRDPAAA